MSTETKPTYYKVLVNGRSCNGGDMAYNLPTQREDGSHEPGKWHEVEGRLSMCRHGLHLTREPARWYKADCEVYVAEWDGDVEGVPGEDEKIACRRVRLLRPVENLADLAIYGPGERHEHRGGYGVAWGNATVRARGNATVEACDNATVRACDNATVEAWGNATVKACDNATVRAWDNATVEAWGNATVKACDNATVRARGNATVKTLSRYGQPTIEISGHAVWIDRRDGAPKVYALAGSWEGAPETDE